MKFARIVSVFVLAVFVVVACDDGDDISGVVIADFAGFWNATQFKYDDATGDHPGFGIDAIAFGGTITLDVAESGAFTGTVAIPGLTVDPQTGETVSAQIGGTISLIDDNTLSIDFNAATEQLPSFDDFDASFTLSGNVLTFVNEDTSFDFPDQVEPTPRGAVAATLTAQFERE